MQTAEAVAEISDYEKERGKPMPSENHAFVQTRLLIAFAVVEEFSVLSELTLELPDGQRLTPDISVYPLRKPNWSHDTIRLKTMPRLVVEIVSPSQGTQEIIDKLDLYFAHGVESAWVVQPAFRTIAIYHLDTRQPQVLVAGEAVDPATGVKARLEKIFA